MSQRNVLGTVTENQILLDSVKVGMSKLVGRFVLESTNIRTHNNPPGLDGMLVEMYTSILARKLVEDRYKDSKVIEVPATWFQHLKQDHAPAWFKERYPVKLTPITVTLSVVFDRYATYPKADVPMPDHMGPMVIREVVSGGFDVTRRSHEKT